MKPRRAAPRAAFIDSSWSPFPRTMSINCASSWVEGRRSSRFRMKLR